LLAQHSLDLFIGRATGGKQRLTKQRLFIIITSKSNSSYMLMIALKCFTSLHNKQLHLVIEHHEMSTNEFGGGGGGGSGSGGGGGGGGLISSGNGSGGDGGSRGGGGGGGVNQ